MAIDCEHEECRYWFECQLSYDLYKARPIVFVFPAAMTATGHIPYWWHSYVVLPVPADYVGIISEACWKEAIAYGMSDANN